MQSPSATNRQSSRQRVARVYVCHSKGLTEHGVDAEGQATAAKYFYVQDHLGSIREVVGADGTTIVVRMDYDAWGNIVSETDGAGNAASVFSDFSYTGHFRHPYAPHLVFAMYRAYAPSLGRWISRDPIGEQGGVNLYGYVRNNVISRQDTLGLVDLNINKLGTGARKAS